MESDINQLTRDFIHAAEKVVEERRQKDASIGEMIKGLLSLIEEGQKRIEALEQKVKGIESDVADLRRED